MDARDELLETDRAFDALAQREGVGAAFVAFAADDAILMRQNAAPILGRAALAAHYARPAGFRLTWRPTRAEVAASGDLGWTYGDWELAATDAEGREVRRRGVYVSVWRRQSDGAWRYVLDAGATVPEE